MFELHLGNCLDVLKTLESDSIDTVITDPPYGLEFMGKDWDHGVPGEIFWQEILRVSKPGASLLAFGGTRTFHRLTCAIEDGGWEIRDCLMWLYGQGFPKSHNLAVGIDKAAGAMGHRGIGFTVAGYTESATVPGGAHGPHEPITDAARQWAGWGTALKPAWEPIVLAMKPISKTFAENALEYGVAGLNIDGGRIKHNEECKSMKAQIGGNKVYAQSGRYQPTTELKPSGRWPANLLLDQEAARQLDRQSGSVSRFFYVAKASRRERNFGLEDLPKKFLATMGDGIGAREHNQKEPGAWTKNHHPTVKPLALMRYLCRLSKTPTGGKVLDPFMGSGTTGVACLMEGREFIGIELEPEYLEIAQRRIQKTLEYLEKT